MTDQPNALLDALTVLDKFSEAIGSPEDAGQACAALCQAYGVDLSDGWYRKVAAMATRPAHGADEGAISAKTTDGYPVNSFSLKDVLAEMLAVATASITEDEQIMDEWPLDCRADVDRWQAVINGHLENMMAQPTTLAREAIEAPTDPLQSYEKFDGVGPHAETIETRASIGERFLECYESALDDPLLKGFTPADCPSEIVFEMLERLRALALPSNPGERCYTVEGNRDDRIGKLSAWVRQAMRFIDLCDADAGGYDDLHSDAERLTLEGYLLFGANAAFDKWSLADLEHRSLTVFFDESHPPAASGGEVERGLMIPILDPVRAEDHPILAPIIEKRARAAGDFTPEFSGQRGFDFDRGLMCAFEAVNGQLQRMSKASTHAGNGGQSEGGKA